MSMICPSAGIPRDKCVDNGRHIERERIGVPYVFLFYLVFTPLSTWWTAVLTGDGFMWNEYLVLILTMLVNFVSEYLYDRFIVFGKSIDTKK